VSLGGSRPVEDSGNGVGGDVRLGFAPSPSSRRCEGLQRPRNGAVVSGGTRMLVAASGNARERERAPQFWMVWLVSHIRGREAETQRYLMPPHPRSSGWSPGEPRSCSERGVAVLLPARLMLTVPFAPAACSVTTPR
jgi:hypothetical protein